VQDVLQRAAHGGVVDVYALETLVVTLACDAWPVDPVAAELGDRIRRDALPLHKIAGAMGRSERDLRRRSRSAFGYGPATLARIVRFHRALGLARRSPRGLAELAVAAGYADQPHMNHDVRALTGTTPGRLLRSTSSPTEPVDH
jgi:transcriptional regulator GlxA family with amidase domain